MATAKRISPPRRSAARQAMRLIVVLLLAVAVLLACYWTPVNAYARTGASYGARVACACRYIGGRTLADCRRDFEPGMALVMLSEDASERSITATFLPLASETARYRKGWGCVLEPY